MPGRSYSSGDGYRFGFQGQETDDEVRGKGNSVFFKYRVHDPRIGRFASVDPLAPEYPFYSPYSFSGNRVIDAFELEGAEPEIDKDGKFTGRYKVKPDQGPSHIAKDMNDNFRSLMSRNIRWEEIVGNHTNYYKYFSHIDRSQLYSDANKDYWALNMNPNDFIDLSFALYDINSTNNVSDTPLENNPFVNLDKKITTLAGGYDTGASFGKSIGSTGLGLNFIDCLCWENNQSIVVDSHGLGYGLAGADFTFGLGKGEIYSLIDNSIVKTINASSSTITSESGSFILAGKVLQVRGTEPKNIFNPTYNIDVGMIGVGLKGLGLNGSYGGVTAESNISLVDSIKNAKLMDEAGIESEKITEYSNMELPQ